MKRIFEKAPFGKAGDGDGEGYGPAKVYDEEVRNSWQLDPSRVKFNNPAWKKGIAAMIPLIAEKFGLGRETPLTLHLYKLLLYTPGGHFAKHRDTEKEDRMLATMVIQLPSVHTGGRLFVDKDN